MHAFLIHSRDREFIDTSVSGLTKTLQSIKLIYELKTIQDVREIQKYVQLTAKEKTTLYIESIDEASIDAQNAFLKSLEEPQENISFILTAENIEQVVPTILSRVELISGEHSSIVPKDVIAQAQDFFNASIGQQLTITSKIKKREEALEFIKNMLLGGHELLMTDHKMSKKLDAAQKTYNALMKNGNVQIQLTHFVTKLSNR